MDVIHLPIACPGIRHGFCPLLATTRPTKHLPKMLHVDIGRKSLFFGSCTRLGATKSHP